MNKTSLIAAIGLVSAGLAAPVLAQPMNGTNNGSNHAAGMTNSTWAKQPSSNDWLVSHLKGVNVYNDQNQKLGSIDELIMDRQGKVEAAVLDVGGFLGMGVHRVAVPFEQLHFADRASANRADNRANTAAPALNNNTNAPGNPSAVGSANTGLGSPATVTGANTATTRTDTANGDRNVPDHATLNMTADQLKAAPEFHYNS